MSRKSLLSLMMFAVLALSAASAHAQYGPPPGPPPPGPPPGGGGGYGYGYGPPPAPPPGVERRGLVLGLSLGAGSFHLECGLACEAFADERYGGGSGTFDIGGMIAPNMAILFDVWAVGFRIDDDRTLFHNMGTVALRFFAARQFWVQGGLGWSNFSLACREDNVDPNCGEDSESGGAVVFAAGVEVFQGPSWALDLSARAGLGSYEEGDVNMGAVQVGFTWY
jgi:hypothetical protein